MNGNQELVKNLAWGSPSVFQRECGCTSCCRACGIQFFGKERTQQDDILGGTMLQSVVSALHS